MRESNDPSDSEVTNLCSLGVVDLDVSLCPDVFGLKAFDEKMPITRMLPGSSPCELRLLLPDNNIGKEGFPVEWCAVWKGSVRECRDHFNDKHSGSATLDLKVLKSFPAWTVTREFWVQALKPEISGIAVDIRLFHESGRRLVHKYRVYRDPIPHPALREGRITKLLSFVYRAMVIAQLTHLRIAIPSSGNPPGEVPSDCFPTTTETSSTKKPRRVTFSPVIQSTAGAMDLLTADEEDTPTNC